MIILLYVAIQNHQAHLTVVPGGLVNNKEMMKCYMTFLGLGLVFFNFILTRQYIQKMKNQQRYLYADADDDDDDDDFFSNLF